MKEFMKYTFDSYCGLNCANCKHKESGECSGCIASNGKPFHGECEIANCAKKKDKRFCGECEDIPCQILKKHTFDEQNGDNENRIQRCKEIKRNMVNKARENLDPFAFCGIHCDYCFLSEWCGGCKSDYNVCSYATICKDGICPNSACAKKRGLEHCAYCSELLTCEVGFYSSDSAAATKAKALFIKNYGKECFENTSKKAWKSSTCFERKLDASESIEVAYKMLEKFI